METGAQNSKGMRGEEMEVPGTGFKDRSLDLSRAKQDPTSLET